MPGMYAIKSCAGRLATLELSDSDANSLLVLAPTRGGMAIRFRVGTEEIFFLDEESLYDLSKNVRGGNPVLFPSPGKLVNDTWTCAGRSGSLKQHGFARNLPWQVVATATDRAASATLRLSSNADTLIQFPWQCS